MVIVPPIAALIFAQMGINPIAGLIAGYAGATAGFTANLLIAGTDVLLAGISTEITENFAHLDEVSATSNWYFMIASTFMLALGGAFIVKRFTIPRCNKFEIENADEVISKDAQHIVTPEEKKGKRHEIGRASCRERV